MNKLTSGLLGLLTLLSMLSGCGRTADNYIKQAITSAQKGNFDKALQELETAAESDPFSAQVYYGLGALYVHRGLLEEARSAFNKGVSLGLDYQLTPSHITSPILKQQGVFTPEEITDRLYDKNDINYIWRCINYKKISNHIIEGCSTDEEKIFALFDWTYRNVAIVARPRKDFAALPLDIMQRGYGLCDRSAWVLVTLADQAGYPGDIFYLRNPETLVSPHTVALIFLQGKWVMFDTYYGIVFHTEDGKTLAGLNDLINNPSLTHTQSSYKKELSRCIAKGIVWIPVEAEAGLPKMQLVQRMLNKFLPQPPKIYHDIYEELCFTLKTLQGYTPGTASLSLPFKGKGKSYEVNVWFYPFRLRIYYAQGAFSQELKKFDPALIYYQRARQSFLIGDYHGALNQYDRLLKTSPNRDYSDDMEYFRSLCYFGAKKYSQAAQVLEKYLKDYPQGKWERGARYHLQRIKNIESKINDK